MCGIAGAFFPGAEGRVDTARVRRMSELISHRGPDADGLWCSDNGAVALAHRRLAVIDLQSGQQPMSDDGSVLVFNGEIYNYRQLRAELVRKGETFRTTSDTEVLLRLLRVEGIACLPRLRGMFSFAFWSASDCQLLLARDPLGKKPLYYMFQDGCFYFASTFQALSQTGIGSRSIDVNAVRDFLALGYVPAPRTIDQSIRKVPAATAMKVSSAGIETHRFWDAADVGKFEGTYEQAADRVDDLVTRATERRLQSDVPLGVFLSGGVDSSLIASVATRLSNQPIQTFSISFDDPRADENAYAAAVARAIGAEHRAFRVHDDLFDLLPEVLRHFGEPFADATALATWLLARESRQFVTVALGGDGGDEAFGGYDWYRTALKLLRIRRVMSRPILAAAQRTAGRAAGMLHTAARANRAFGMLQLDRADQFAALRSFFSDTDGPALYRGDLADAHASAKSGEQLIADSFARCQGSSLQRMRVADIETYLGDCLLPKVDVPTMAFGLEARAPLLDLDVVEFALSLPDDWLVGKAGGKRILKSVLYRYLPRSLFERPKQGFDVPLRTWFAGPLRNRIAALHDSPALADTGWFNPAAIRQIVDEQAQSKRDHSQRLFSLLVMEQWLSQ